MYTQIELRPRLWQYWNVKALWLAHRPTSGSCHEEGLVKETKREKRGGRFFIKKGKNYC